MKILITGASGLVGSKLVPELKGIGHTVLKLTRKKAENSDEIIWDPEKGINPEELKKLEGLSGVIHLAGASVADWNWTEEKKKRIRDSRVLGTRVLVDSLAKLDKKPGIFISASAIGYYGDRGDEILSEKSPAGSGFLPEVCKEWEAEADKARNFGARTSIVRVGMVLSKEGGALGKMLTPFSYGLGGVVGSGKQYMSWISLEDLVRVFVFLLNNDDIEGAVNGTSPNPVTNEEFTVALGKVVRRPTFIPVPEFGVKLIFGEMGQNLLLNGARVIPARLEESGFEFKYADLTTALRKAIE